MSGGFRRLKGREQAEMGSVRAQAGPPDGRPQMPGQQKGLALEGAESHRILRKMEPQAEMELRRGVSRGGRGTSSGKDGGACVCACQVNAAVSGSTTVWAVAVQAPVSMGFSRQEDWSGLPRPPAGDRPNSGAEPMSQASCIGRRVLYH